MSTSQPLFFQSSGPADAPTIVFLHGGGAAGWMWQPVIDRLPEYHCLALDLPEQGQSRQIGPFSMALAAEKVAEVIRSQAQGGKAILVGLSEGAQVAVQLLASRPELVERALISSALVRPLPGANMITPGLLGWSFKMTVPPFRNSDWWIRLNMKYSAGIPADFYTQFKQEFQQMTESGFVNLMIANQRFRLPAGLEKAQVPTLIVVGSKEYAAMKQSARDLAAALPDAKAVQVHLGKNSSLASEHNWAMSAPALFAETLRATITGKPLPDQLSFL